MHTEVLGVRDRQGRTALRGAEDALEHVEDIFVSEGCLDDL